MVEAGASARGPRLALAIVLLLAALVGGWRWWLGPRREAEARAGSPELEASRERAAAALAELAPALASIELEGPGPTAVELRWTAPRCVEVYRLRVDERFREPSVAVFLGRPEQHASWLLAITADPGSDLDSDDPAAVVPVLGLLEAEAGLEGDDAAPRRRSLSWGAREVGPAAPDFACRTQTWDPFEDLLALGWPRLPAGPIRVGERWQGASVEGRCLETTCLDDEGRFRHEPPCRTRPWSETLVAAGEAEGHTVAALRGQWSDERSDPEAKIGILTSREAVLVDGRPLQVSAVVEHRWAGVTRALELELVDDCGAIPIPPAAGEQIAAIRARLAADAGHDPAIAPPPAPPPAGDRP